MSEKIVNFRVEEDLKNAFEMVAKKSDLTSSQLLRAFMRETVDNFMKKDNQGSLLEPSKPKGNTKAKGKAKTIPEAWRFKG